MLRRDYGRKSRFALQSQGGRARQAAG